MASNLDSKINVTLELQAKGIKKLESEVVSTFKNIPRLLDNLKGDVFKDMRGSLSGLSGDTDSIYGKLKRWETAVDNLKTKYQAMEEAGSISPAAQQALVKSAESLGVRYQNLARELGTVKIRYDAIETAAAGTYQTILSNTKQSITNMETYGASVKEVAIFTKRLGDAQREAETTNNKSGVAALNKEFASRADILQQVTILQKKLSNSTLPKGQFQDISKSLETMRAKAASTEVSIDSLKLGMKDLKLSAGAVKGFDKYSDSISKAIVRMKGLGATDKEIGRLVTKFNDLYFATLKSGDTTKLGAFNSELVKRADLTQKLVVLEDKLNDSRLTQTQKQDATKLLEKTQAGVLKPTTDTTQLKNDYNELSKLVGNLTQKEKEYDQAVKSSVTGLESQAKKLLKEKENILRKLDEESATVTKGDKSAAVKQIKTIEAAVGDITTKIEKLNSLEVVSESKANNAINKLNEVKKTTEAVVQKSKSVAIDVGLSGGIDKVKKAFVGLENQLDNLVVANKEFKNSSEYKTATAQIKEQQELLERGGKTSLRDSKAAAAELQKRLSTYVELNREADKLTQEANSYDSTLSNLSAELKVIAQDYRNAAAQQLDLKTTAAEYSVIVGQARDKAAGLSDSMKDVNNIEKQVLQTQNAIEDKLGDLRRLYNAKIKFAPAAELKKAKAEAEAYEAQLKEVKSLLQKLSTAKNKVKVDATEVADLQKQADKATASLRTMTHTTKDVKAGLASVSKIKWFGNIAQRAVAYAGIYAGFYEVITLMRKGVGAVVEFDTQMRTMAAVFDITTSRANVLTHQLIGLAKAWGGSVTEINEAALALGRAGIATDKVTTATEIVIKMAKLTGDSIGVSANAMITYQQVFGESHPIMKELGDQLAYVANQSRLSTQDIGTFSNYALAAAKAAGISLEAINSLAISFSNAGVNASTIGTQIRRFSSLLKANSSSARDFFTSLGTSQQFFAAQLQASVKSSDASMKWLVKRLKNLSDNEFAKAIQGMDILAANSLTLMRNNADEFLRHFNVLQEGVTGEIDKANLISDSYASAYDKLAASAGEAFQQMTITIAPMLESLLKKVTEMFEAISDNSDRLIKALKFGLQALGAVAAAVALGGLNSLIVSLVRVKTGMALAAAGTRIFAGALTFLMAHPVIAALAVIGTATYAAYEYFSDGADSVKKYTKQVSELDNQSQRYADKILKTKKELIKTTEALQVAEASDKDTLIKKQAHLTRELQIYERLKNSIDSKSKLAGEVERIQAMQDRIQSKKIEKKIALSIGEDTAHLDAQIKRMEGEVEPFNLKLEVSKKEAEISDIDTAVVNIRQRIAKMLDDTGNLRADASKTELDKEKELVSKLLAVRERAVAEQTKLQQDLKQKTGTGSLVPDIKEKDLAKLNTLIAFAKKYKEAGGDATSTLKHAGEQAKEYVETLSAGLSGGLDTKVLAVNAQVDELGKGFSKAAKTVNDTLLAEVEKIKEETEFSKQVTAIDKLSTAFQKVDFGEDNSALASLWEGIVASLNTFVEKGIQAKTVLAQSNEELNGTDSSIEKILNKSEKLVAISKGYQNSLKEGADISEWVNKLLANGIDLSTAMGQSSEALIAKDKLRVTLLAKQMDITAEIVYLMGLLKNTDADWMTGDVQAAISEHVAKLNTQLKEVQSSIKLQEGAAKRYNKSTDKAAKDAEKEYDTRLKISGLINSLNGDAQLEYAAQYRDIFKDIYEFFPASDADAKAQEYISAKLDNLRKFRADEILNDSGNPIAQEYADAQRRIDLIKDLYQERRGVIEGQIQQITKLVADGKMKELDAERKIDELRKQQARETSAEMAAIQQEQFNNTVSMVGTVLGTLDTVMGQFYSAIFGDAKGAYEAQAQAVADLKEEIFSAEAQLTDLRAIQDANPDIVVDAQIAQLEAKTAAMEDNLSAEEKQAQQDKENEVRAKTMFETMKKIQVASAIASTYLSAQKAFEGAMMLGGPFAYPVAIASMVASLAIGMGNVAQIAAQKYHTGGYVDKPNINGMGGMRDDEITATLQKGEYVLSKDDVRNIKSSYNSNKSDSNTQAALFSQMADSLKQEVVIVNSMDPAVIEDWATTRRGREVIQNIVNN